MYCKVCKIFSVGQFCIFQYSIQFILVSLGEKSLNRNGKTIANALKVELLCNSLFRLWKLNICLKCKSKMSYDESIKCSIVHLFIMQINYNSIRFLFISIININIISSSNCFQIILFNVMHNWMLWSQTQWWERR